MSIKKEFEFFLTSEKLPDVSKAKNVYVLTVAESTAVIAMNYSKYGFNTYDDYLFRKSGDTAIPCRAWAYLPDEWIKEFFSEKEGIKA